MTIEHTVHVSAPPNVVWTCLKDIPTILEHIPGARFSGSAGALAHNASFTIPGGAARGTYNLSIAVQSLDDTAHTAVVNVTGNDAAGRGGLNATLRIAVQPAGAGSDIMLHADAEMSGAQIPELAGSPGAGVPPAFANAASQFAANLERTLRR